jgi:hypothetical protein
MQRLDRTSRRLLNKSIAVEVARYLKTDKDLDLAAICKSVQSKHGALNRNKELILAFRQAAEAALRRKSGSKDPGMT